MSQADGKNKLKRFEFEFGDKTYKFVLNPEEYTQNEPSRVSITQTRGGGFVDAWGAAFPTINFKGTTGFKNGTDDPTNGFKKFKELEELIREVYDDVKPGQKVTKLLKFYNYTDEEYWYTYPEKFALVRSKSKSLLYQYEVSLRALAKVGSYNPLTVTQLNTTGGTDVTINPGTIQRTQLDTSENSSNSTNQTWLSEQTTSNNNNVSQQAVTTDDESSSKIIEVTAPLQVGIQYQYNIDETDYVVSNLKILMQNMVDIFGGNNGKVSPVVAKYLTSNLEVLQSGIIPNIYCSITVTSGGSEIAFINKWSEGAIKVYNDLKEYSEYIIEVDSYYQYINTSLPKAVPNTGVLGIDYKQLVPILLNQGETLQDSNLVNVLRRYNLNTNYLLMIKSVIINSIRAYVELKNYMDTYTKIPISTIELDTLLNNIKYVSGLMESYSEKERPIDLIKELRKLQIAITDMRGTPELFDNYSRGGY
jgi:hypothetical protein